jgi:predicted PurR-regulated permease PerM
MRAAPRLSNGAKGRYSEKERLDLSRNRRAIHTKIAAHPESSILTMESAEIDSERFRTAFVLILVLAISALFAAVVWPFLQALLIGAMLAGFCHPLYRWLARLFRGRDSLASAVTLFLLFLLVVGPLSALLGLVVRQALSVSEHAIPWFQERFGAAGSFDIDRWLVERFPLAGNLLPSQGQIVNNLATAAKTAGGFLVAWVSAFTAGTAGFFLRIFVMVYAMFFFLRDGRSILQKVFYYMPLRHEDEIRMLDRFVSVTRATIKGTLLIGLLQGSLAGTALYFAGINGAAFWGTVMVVLSVIPGIGTALVWVPAAIYLFVIGETLSAILLVIWCAGVVGTIDNFLRPTLVGKDAQMPDLLILIGTLGGLFLFGPIGLIVGPVVCGLFLTALDIYGTTFKDVLPPATSLTSNPVIKPKRSLQDTPRDDPHPPIGKKPPKRQP